MFKFNFQGIKSRIRVPRIRLPEQHGPSKRLSLIIAGVLAVVLLIALGYGFSYTSQASFCAKCHELQPAIKAWQTSLHAEVECNVCHATGFVDKLQQKVDLVGRTYRHFTKAYPRLINEDSKLSKKIDNDGCLQCHTPKRVITPRKDLIMDHNVHIEKGVNCTTCHNRAGHPTSSGYKDFISMEGCFRCHGLSKTALAPGRCDKCHSPEFDLEPKSHKVGTWQVPDHGKTAKQNMDSCMTCHQKTFCTGCHGVEIPHPDKFVKGGHGAFGEKNPQVCQRCHRQKDFCNACHHKGYDERAGTWPATHKKVVAVVGPAHCFNCHGPTYCAICHVRGEKQPRTEKPPQQ